MTASTCEQIIEWAKQAGLDVRPDGEILPRYLGGISDGYASLAKIAYAAGQAAENAACLQVCSSYIKKIEALYYDESMPEYQPELAGRHAGAGMCLAGIAKRNKQ